MTATKFFSILTIVLNALLLLSGCATTGEWDNPAAKYQHYSEQQLFTLGSQDLARHRYSKAADVLSALDSLYPFGKYSQKAQLQIIYAYFKKKDYASASAAADRYIRLYPHGKHIDYVYYLKGLSDLNQNETFLQRIFPIDMAERNLDYAKQAFYDFRDLVQQFPDSQYAPDARQHMVYLRNMFARHEMEISEYYFKRHAYVAAANRANYIVTHYQRTDEIEPALAMLVRTNRALGLNKAADDARHVLEKNYPHSSALKRQG